MAASGTWPHGAPAPVYRVAGSDKPAFHRESVKILPDADGYRSGQVGGGGREEVFAGLKYFVESAAKLDHPSRAKGPVEATLSPLYHAVPPAAVGQVMVRVESWYGARRLRRAGKMRMRTTSLQLTGTHPRACASDTPVSVNAVLLAVLLA